MLVALLLGFVLAFVGSMPVAGPIAAIMVGKGLEGRRRAGLYIAVGAAASESVYACLAFLGLSAALGAYPLLLPVSRVLGCFILVGLGVYFVGRKPGGGQARNTGPGEPEKPALRYLALGFSVTLFNPTLIVTWTAAVSAAHATGFLRVQALDAFPFAAGVALGIVSWFATLLWLLVRFQKRMRPELLGRVIRWMGVLLILGGVGVGIRTVLTWGRP